MTEAGSRPIRTRFAPSPTGFLHVGGARTALFNWLFARKHGGQFVLRIEDTDKARNTAESLVGILQDMQWLGLTWDEGPELAAVRRGALGSTGPYAPYYQSERDALYATYFARLLADGYAYFAWETPEELESARIAAQKAKLTYRYQRPTTLVTDEVEARKLAAGKPIVIRFASPQQTVHVNDVVLGPTDFPADHVDDFVIRKADGGPTFHFAVVVDDELMQISHIIRAQEHFNNTPKHVALQDALGFSRPTYAHLPLVFNEAGTKMSKRDKDKAVKGAAQEWLKKHPLDGLAAIVADGEDPTTTANTLAAWLDDKKGVLQDGELRSRVASAVGLTREQIPEIDVNDFRQSGYLPEIILNYIALLGWSAGDDRERYTLEDLIPAFTLERIGKTNARFDRAKLLAFNTERNNEYAQTEPGRSRLRDGLRDYLAANPQSALAQASPDDATLDKLLAMNEGFRLFRDIDDKCGILFADDQAVIHDPKSVEKVLRKGNGLATLRALRPVLAEVSAWAEPALEHAAMQYASAHGLKIGDVAQPLRVAVTGRAVSPPMWATLDLLGRAKTLARIDRCLAEIA